MLTCCQTDLKIWCLLLSSKWCDPSAAAGDDSIVVEAWLSLLWWSSNSLGSCDVGLKGDMHNPIHCVQILKGNGTLDHSEEKAEIEVVTSVGISILSFQACLHWSQTNLEGKSCREGCEPEETADWL